MGLEIGHPADVAEAKRWLRSVPLPTESITPARYRGDEHLDSAFASGLRAPEHVWAARADGRVLAVVSVLEQASGVLNYVAGTDPAAVAAVVRAVSEELPEMDVVTLFAPPGSDFDLPQLAPWVAAFDASGWRRLVARRHYEFTPAPGLGQGFAMPLRLEVLTDPADPRLIEILREVMRSTLDAYDLDQIARRGFDAAVEQARAALVEDPVDWVRLAYAGDRLVGLTCWFTASNDRGYFLLGGVRADARHRGFGTALLAAATRAMLADGATTLVGDTDNDNLPMARAFARVGWQQAETRLDFVR